MSVTFSINRPRKLVKVDPCPECGAVYGEKHGKLACPYQRPVDPYPCDGYGLVPVETLAEEAKWLNVSNINAGVILFDLLDYSRSELDPSYGTLDPSDVLRRLALSESRISGCARPASESRVVYIDSNGVGPGALVVDCGLSEDRVGHYIEKIRALADEAAAEGRDITYG